MRFTTLAFLVFFIAVYVVYWTVTGRTRLIFIFLASILFYATWSVGFAIHFVSMVGFTYLIVKWMQKSSSSVAFYVGVIANLGNLFLFKYFYLLLEILKDATGSNIFKATEFNSWLFSRTGYDSIVLPLAISFYTFVLVAYLFDVHRGIIKEKHSFLEFGVFAMYFPHLVAGPIIRHSDFFYQLGDIKADQDKIVRGMFLILTGLVKKVAIADNILPLFSRVFLKPDEYSGAANAMAAVSFSIWVFCDFSGYTDLARGMSLLLGIELPENFRAPFLSRSVRELWRNWHSTLGTWMRDYVYIPLGGSRRGEVRSQVNLLTTFTLGGLWHGAHYPYIIWGFFHGLMLVLERFLGLGLDKVLPTKIQLPRALDIVRTGLQVVFVFILFCIGAVFFNSPTVTSAFTMLGRAFTWVPGSPLQATETLSYFVIAGFLLNGIQLIEKWPSLKLSHAATIAGVYGFIVMFLLAKYAPGGRDFLYFQF